jgi:CBS domain-containing protein
MAKTAKEAMAHDPIKLSASATLRDAAQSMRDRDIGNVLVFDQKRLCGIVTDRDIVVRGLADGADPGQKTLGEICGRDLVTVSPDDSVDKALALMASKALRRIPVVEDGNVRGILSLGDLAVQSGERSVLAGVSAASPNR